MSKLEYLENFIEYFVENLENLVRIYCVYCDEMNVELSSCVHDNKNHAVNNKLRGFPLCKVWRSWK